MNTKKMFGDHLRNAGIKLTEQNCLYFLYALKHIALTYDAAYYDNETISLALIFLADYYIRWWGINDAHKIDDAISFVNSGVLSKKQFDTTVELALKYEKLSAFA